MFTKYIKDFETLKQNYKSLLNTINHYEEVIIFRHVRPDPDALGAQLGLKAVLKNIFPNKKVAALGDNEPSLSIFGEMDSVTAYDDPLVIVVDTANSERVDGDISIGDKVVKIDHHPDREAFGDINIVETGVSSTSELIYMLISLWGFDNDFIDDEAAKFLYLGIVGDTGRFLFNNTTELTHLVASELKKFDFEATKLMEDMNHTDEQEFRFKGYLIDNYEITPTGILHVYVSKETLDEYGISSNVASLNVNMYRELEDAKVWFMAIEEDDQLRVRLRSKEVVINDVAEAFGGGGHPLASGIRIGKREQLQDLISLIERKL